MRTTGSWRRLPRRPSLPFRLATFTRTSAGAQLLRQGYGVRDAADRLAGRVEVGVKIYVRRTGRRLRADAEPAPAGQVPPQLRQAAPAPRRAWRHATTAAEQMDAVLAGLAVDRRQHRPQSAQLSAAAGENVFNAAYLVDAGRVEEFADRAQRLAGDEPARDGRGHGPLAAVFVRRKRSRGAVVTLACATGTSRWSTCSTGSWKAASC